MRQSGKGYCTIEGLPVPAPLALTPALSQGEREQYRLQHRNTNHTVTAQPFQSAIAFWKQIFYLFLHADLVE